MNVKLPLLVPPPVSSSVPLRTCTAPEPFKDVWIVASPELVVRLMVPVLVVIWLKP